MQRIREQSSIEISLLHATYRAGQAAVANRNHWLELARHPNLIEHIFAFNADDEVSLATPEICNSGLALPATPGRVTAVRNWNAAASAAGGSILVVIADDLLPGAAEWDESLRYIIGCLDPLLSSFVVKVQDSNRRDDHLIRHPIISRAYLRRYGLFNPVYRGIGADNDFTFSAHCRGLVVDGRDLVFEHRHPTMGATPSESHHSISSSDELDYGKSVLASRWPRWRRRIHYSYHPPAHPRAALPRGARAQRTVLALCGLLRPPTLVTLAQLMRSRVPKHKDLAK